MGWLLQKCVRENQKAKVQYRVDAFRLFIHMALYCIASLVQLWKGTFVLYLKNIFAETQRSHSVTYCSLVSYQSASFSAVAPSSSAVMFHFIPWFSTLLISTLRIHRAKLLWSRTFRKGWTLTFCKMSELLLDPSFASSVVWLDSGCVLSSRWAHTQMGGHWSTNRCHGSKEGVDWSLERPHSSTHTPERTPGSHTLFISQPFCFSLLSHPYDFTKLALTESDIIQVFVVLYLILVNWTEELS